MSPGPLNLISATALLPIVLYFWIRLTSPQAVNVEKWSFRFLVALAVLSSLGIYGYHLARSSGPGSAEIVLRNQLAETQRKNEQLTKDLSGFSPSPGPTAMASGTPGVSGESIADLLSEEPSPGSVHRITAKSGVASIDVYQTAAASSKKIGSLESGINYPYLEKSGGWYKVIVTSAVTGWVNSAQVQEVY